MKILAATMFFCLLVTVNICFSQVSNGEMPTIKYVSSQKLSKVQKFNDFLSIISISAKKNIVTIETEYTGGCKKHIFYVVKDNSNNQPEILNLMIFHNSNADDCKAIVNEKLKIDLLKFKIDYKTLKTINVINYTNKEVIKSFNY